MKFLTVRTNQIAIIILIILVLAGSYVVYSAYLPSETHSQNQSEISSHPLQTGSISPGQAQSSSSLEPAPGTTPDSVSVCTPLITDSRIAVPANISNAIRDPIPGIRYSLNENESGRTIVLGKGDVVEINLRWVPGVAWDWIITTSGCGIELVQSGVYSDGGDFWNNTGHYRVRYRAVSPGTSIIDGIFGVSPRGTATESNPRFNLTVIVKQGSP